MVRLESSMHIAHVCAFARPVALTSVT